MKSTHRHMDDNAPLKSLVTEQGHKLSQGECAASRTVSPHAMAARAGTLCAQLKGTVVHFELCDPNI